MLIPEAHIERGAARTDGHRPVSQLACKVEGFTQRLLLRQTQRVLGHLRLDACAYLRCGAEEPIRRRHALKPLVRTLEVVVLDKERHPALAVLEVGEHRPRQQFLPQGLPEPLDLPACLRMMRAALHVHDSMALKLRLELRAPSPGGVLAALVRQDLPRRAVVGDAA